jgi:uncharacterized membrane protein YcaP (DUF421 family)
MFYTFPIKDHQAKWTSSYSLHRRGVRVHRSGAGTCGDSQASCGDALMSTIPHANVGYIFLTIMVRVLIRRPGAQMTQLEFVLVFLMGGIIIASTVGKDHSLTNSTCAVLAMGCMHRLISSLKIRCPKFARLVDGTPLVLVRNGEWQTATMAGMRLAPEDVMAAARTKGIRSFDDMEYAILERNGGISLIEKEPKDGR